MRKKVFVDLCDYIVDVRDLSKQIHELNERVDWMLDYILDMVKEVEDGQSSSNKEKT